MSLEKQEGNASGETKRMVIVGGDFAGLACAGELAKTDEVQATLTDNNNFQQCQPLLYQLTMAELGNDCRYFPARVSARACQRRRGIG